MDTNEKLQKVLTKSISDIEGFYGPLIFSCDVFIGMLEEANQDASNYFNIHEGKVVNYYKRRDTLISERDEAVKQIEVEVALQKERIAKADDVTPEEGDIRWEEIAFVIIKKLVQDGVKIKVGDIEWDSTKPLGGEGSVFDELRDGTFNALGIDPDSDLAAILKDPFNKNIDTSDFGQQLTDIREATGKALTDIKRETDKALTDIKETADKALTDIHRETSKALTDARRAADKAAKDIGRELGRSVRKLPKIGKGFKW